MLGSYLFLPGGGAVLKYGHSLMCPNRWRASFMCSYIHTFHTFPEVCGNIARIARVYKLGEDELYRPHGGLKISHFKGTSIRKNSIPYQSPKSMKK